MPLQKLLLPIIFVLFIFQTGCKKDNEQDNNIELLHAERGVRKGFFDAQGRQVILRGVNYNCLGDYWVANQDVPPVKPYDPEDFRMMAEEGFNCVRLLFHWSRLEPVRGQYNQAYITDIKRAIEDASRYGIYVLLDMHQDAWGKYIASKPEDACNYPNNGWDGAPEWATFTDGQSTCKDDASGVGGRETAPAVYHAFQHFFDNTDGIQDACINAWAALAKETAKYPNVVGYDILNEPNLGYKPLLEEVGKLGRFYGKTIAAIRNAERSVGAPQHIMFFEMSVTWQGQGIPFIAMPDFTDDKNIVFAPHTYFEAITYLLTLEQGYDLLSGLSNAYQTGMFIGEYGYFDGDINVSVAKLKRFAVKEDGNFGSSTYWQWCQTPGDPHGISWDGQSYGERSMALIETDWKGNYTGNKNEALLRILSRSYPRAIQGKPKKFSADPENGALYLEAATNQEGHTLLWLNQRFGEPKFRCSNGEVKALQQVYGGYLADISVRDTYSIEVYYE